MKVAAVDRMSKCVVSECDEFDERVRRYLTADEE